MDAIKKVSNGKRLKMARIALGITQKELANKLGLKWYQIKDLELDKTKLSAELAFQLQQKFGISTSWLLTGEGEMFIDKNNSINQSFTGDNNKNIIQGINSNINQNFNNINEKENYIDVELDKILNRLKEIIKNDHSNSIKELLLNIVEGNYTPKLINDFNNKLNKLKEIL